MAVYLLLAYCDIDIICMYTDETEIKIYIYFNFGCLQHNALSFQNLCFLCLLFQATYDTAIFSAKLSQRRKFNPGMV